MGVTGGRERSCLFATSILFPICFLLRILCGITLNNLVNFRRAQDTFKLARRYSMISRRGSAPGDDFSRNIVKAQSCTKLTILSRDKVSTKSFVSLF